MIDIKKVENLYIPEYCIQGENIPMYFIWDRSREIIVKVTPPKGIGIKEIYNVNEDGFEMKGPTLIVKKLEINGYLGIIFKSSCYKKPKVNKTILLMIIQGQEEKTIKKTIELFRPEIRVTRKPKKIEINIDENNKMQIKDKISIRNVGNGTALINLKIKEGSELLLSDPKGISEFTVKFWADFEKKLDRVKGIYPIYSNLIDNFVRIGKNPPSFDAEGVSQIKDTFVTLYRAFEDDPSFLDDFAKTLVSSYMKNISIITEVDSFITYLKSIQSEKIVLFDAVKVIKVSPQSKKLKAELTITDLAYNTYDPINLMSIQFKSNIEYDVPIYSILEFVGNREGG